MRARRPVQRWWLAIPLVAVAAAAGLAIGLSGGDGPHAAPDRHAAPRSGTVALRLRSRPDLRPPQVVVDRAASAPGGDRILISPRADEQKVKAPGHQQGAMLLDEEGRTLWFGVAPHGAPVLDLEVQRYRGRPVLTWWQGSLAKGGIGAGKDVIVDSHYHRIATVRTSAGLGLDLHEFRLTPRGTALVTVYARTRADLRSMGGPRDGRVTEGIAEEIDVATGRVLWEWHSLDHVAPSESVMPLPGDRSASFDYFHINAVDEDPARGAVLISARNTSTVYEVDRDTGRVVWRLGGKESDFAVGPGAEFGLQHDARYRGDDEIELFDNGAEDTKPASSAKTLVLDAVRRRATLLRRLDQPQGLWAESQGSTSDLAGGGAFVGWGSLGRFSRFDAAGRMAFDAHLPEGYDSYRAFLQPWTGRPGAPPAVAAERDGSATTVYASWNGETGVRAWQVLAGPGPDRLEPVGGPVAWTGLETAIPASTSQPFVAVRAIGAGGRALGSSRAIRR